MTGRSRPWKRSAVSTNTSSKPRGRRSRTAFTWEVQQEIAFASVRLSHRRADVELTPVVPEEPKLQVQLELFGIRPSRVHVLGKACRVQLLVKQPEESCKVVSATEEQVGQDGAELTLLTHER